MMALTDNEYSKTGMLLKTLSIVMVVYGFYGRSAAEIAMGCGYYMAAANPMRYRIIINTGILFHFLQLIRSLYYLASADAAGFYGDLIVSPLSLAVLIKYYPSPYPVSSNILSFLMPARFNVSLVDAFPGIVKKLAGNGIIGKVEGLYINTDAFNIVQEEGFQSFTPSSDILETAKKAGVQHGKTLLDVGCGMGGPACVLAEELGLDRKSVV
jgi:hypothetical protein